MCDLALNINPNDAITYAVKGIINSFFEGIALKNLK